MRDVFLSHLKSRGFKFTGQRERILNAFLKVKSHVSAEELYFRVKKLDPSIGQATVFRFMKLLVESGIAQSSGLGERGVRYEPRRKHHDHLICTICGVVLEFTSSVIEKEQQRIVSRTGFILKDHRMELYGLCPTCKNSRKEAGRA